LGSRTPGFLSFHVSPSGLVDPCSWTAKNGGHLTLCPGGFSSPGFPFLTLCPSRFCSLLAFSLEKSSSSYPRAHGPVLFLEFPLWLLVFFFFGIALPPPPPKITFSAKNEGFLPNLFPASPLLSGSLPNGPFFLPNTVRFTSSPASPVCHGDFLSLLTVLNLWHWSFVVRILLSSRWK